MVMAAAPLLVAMAVATELALFPEVVSAAVFQRVGMVVDFHRSTLEVATVVDLQRSTSVEATVADLQRSTSVTDLKMSTSVALVTSSQVAATVALFHDLAIVLLLLFQALPILVLLVLLVLQVLLVLHTEVATLVSPATVALSAPDTAFLMVTEAPLVETVAVAAILMATRLTSVRRTKMSALSLVLVTNMAIAPLISTRTESMILTIRLISQTRGKSMWTLEASTRTELGTRMSHRMPKEFPASIRTKLTTLT